MSSTMAAPKTPGKSKLRASCDRCHQAKLKCIFEDLTVCIRCKKRRASCIRSPSMPLGRTSGSRNKRRKSPVTDYPTPREFKTSSPSYSSSDAPPQNESTSSEITETTDNVMGLDQTLLGLDSAPFELESIEWSDGHTLYTPQNRTSPAQHVIEAYPERIFSPIEDSEEHLFAGCDCLSGITRMMENPQQRGFIGEKTIDELLQQNKSALQSLSNALLCKASHDTSWLSFSYLLLQRVLASYADAWFMGFIPSAAVGGTTSVQSFLRPREPNIWLGSFAIDQEDCDALKRRLIFLEVQKIIPLLDKLEQRSCKDPTSSEGLKERHCLSMQTFLRVGTQNLIDQLAEAS